MRLTIKILLGVYLVVVTYLAYPMVYDIIHQEDKPASVQQLDASGSDEQWEFLKDYALLILYADEIGYKLTGGEMMRTMYQQRHYVAIGRSWTYNSYHLKRKAGDLNLFINNKYQTAVQAYEPLGRFWESLDEKNTWGGRWKRTPDAPHFQRSD